VRDESCDDFVDDGNYAWEWWYKWQVSDNISITPAIFYLSRPLGQSTTNVAFDGGRDRDRDFSLLGGLVQATFTF
jgi:carbohydrate-selective porin OprB